jgi:WhiB family transcriptional regulator, redox-sensing transcriptional regulator
MGIAPNCTWPATMDPADVFDALSELLEATRRPAWHADAACRGQADLFFPVRGAPTEPAKAICARCPSREPCLAAALGMSDESTIGIWGGTSARERKRMRRRQVAA